MTVDDLRRALADAPGHQEVKIVLHGRTVSSIAVAAEYTSGGPGTPFNVVAQHPADAHASDREGDMIGDGEEWEKRARGLLPEPTQRHIQNNQEGGTDA